MAPKAAAKEKDKPAEPAPAPAEAPLIEKTAEEEACQRIFKQLDGLFKKLSKTNKPDKLHSLVKDITAKLKEAKGLVGRLRQGQAGPAAQ